TQDDITRDAIAAVCGVPLELHEPSRAHIEQLFRQRRREMPASNLKQAMIPRGGEAIPNPHGSAPGIEAPLPTSRGQCSLFALPGVPAEMREMWEATVKPHILSRTAADGTGPQRTIIHRSLRCFGVGESALEQEIAEFLARGREPSIGITVHRATINLRITARGASADECHAAIEGDMSALRQRLGRLVFGEGEAEIQDALIGSLARAHVQVATSERLTRGLLARWLAAADAGPGGCVAGGITAPQGDPLLSLDSCRQEAERVARQFAAGAVIVIGDLDHKRNEVPLLVQYGKQEAARSLPWSGHPDIREERTAKTAIDLLRRLLDGDAAT
ncbi:MAG: molybdopterin-binding protein, partial [Planctomycetota bacterium]